MRPLALALVLPIALACENPTPAPATVSAPASAPGPALAPASARASALASAPALAPAPTPANPATLADTRPACTAASMDLASVIRDCSCHAVRAPDGGTPLCAWPDEAAVALAVRSLALHADVPASAAGGSTVTIALRLENTSAAPLPLYLDAEATPFVWLRDTQGSTLPVPYDAACKPGPPMLAMAPSHPESHVVLPPGGVLTAHATVSLTKTKRANVKVAGGDDMGGLLGGLGLPGKDVNAPVGGPPPKFHMACKEVPAGPLAPGDYVVEPTIGLLPDAMSAKVDPHVTIHVK